MRVSNLSLVNFRNYSKLEAEFTSGINLLYGRNGSGKTNLVEAISFCSLGKSFRTSEDFSLIKDKEDFARIRIDFINQKKHQIETLITKDGKKIIHNDIRLEKLSLLAGILNTISFVPEDVSLFKSSPNNRRRFLDIAGLNLYRGYIKDLSEYRNYLKQRNALLKSESIDEKLIELFNEKMIDNQYSIINYRKQIFERLEIKLNQVFKRIDEGDSKLKIKYVCDLKKDATYDEFKKETLRQFHDDFENDLKRKSTTSGIHHDDFRVYLDDKDVGQFASQGQNRIISLSLKLAYGELVKETTKTSPILILDDVLSELDEVYQSRLIEFLKEYEQVFITSAEDDDINGISRYQVINGNVIRRN